MNLIRTTALILLAAASAATAAETERALAAKAGQQYIVKLTAPQSNGNGPAQPPVRAFIPTLGGHVDFDWQDRVVVTLPDAAVAALKSHREVKYLQRVVSGPFTTMAGGTTQSATVRGASALALRTTAPTSIPPWDSGVYAYDDAGNISAIGTDTFVYDGLSRLKQASVRGQPLSYTYDEFGNLTNKTEGITAAFPASRTTNRLTLEQYDAAGNDVGDGSAQSFGYDPFNMMREKDESALTATYYVYTPSDERIGVLTCPTVSPYCNQSNWTWSLRDETGKVLRQYQSTATSINTPWTWIEDYVHRNGQLLGAERVAEEGGRRHFHLDHLGTPRLVTSDAGTRMGEHNYYPFGVEIAPSFQDTASGWDREDPLRFTGHERDLNIGSNSENSNYNDSLHARQRIPQWGRFLSVDPNLDMDKALREPQRWNRYAYVQNNPLRYTDPNGRDARDLFYALGPAASATGGDLVNIGAGLIHYNEVREAAAGWGSASASERLMAAGVIGIAVLDVGSNALAPEKGAAVEGGTKLLSAAKLMDHHLLPQQFGKFFEAAGININKFTVTLSEAAHLRGVHGSGLADMPGGWNKAWKGWIEANPNATSKEIYQQLGKMMDEFKLNNLNIHGYRAVQ